MSRLNQPADRSHRRMWGALFVKDLPGISRPSFALEHEQQGLFLLWLSLMGLLLFAASVMAHHGLWHQLVQADPTGLTLVIVALFTGCSIWVGLRSWQLGMQWQTLHRPNALTNPETPSWSAEYLTARDRCSTDNLVLQQILSDKAHGPHEMLWWLNGIQLKLGLLGKVIGFSVLAFELGRMDGFDPQQSAHMLKSLTSGLGIALLTTITGLTANILLGLQLMRLDRFSDSLVAEILRCGECQAMSEMTSKGPT